MFEDAMWKIRIYLLNSFFVRSMLWLKFIFTLCNIRSIPIQPWRWRYYALESTWKRSVDKLPSNHIVFPVKWKCLILFDRKYIEVDNKANRNIDIRKWKIHFNDIRIKLQPTVKGSIDVYILFYNVFLLCCHTYLMMSYMLQFNNR